VLQVDVVKLFKALQEVVDFLAFETEQNVTELQGARYLLLQALGRQRPFFDNPVSFVKREVLPVKSAVFVEQPTGRKVEVRAALNVGNQLLRQLRSHVFIDHDFLHNFKYLLHVADLLELHVFL